MAVSLALAAPAASAGAAPATADRASSCPKSGTITKISGKRTCLAAGRACASSKQKQYRKNGYSCSKGRLKKVKQAF